MTNSIKFSLAHQFYKQCLQNGDNMALFINNQHYSYKELLGLVYHIYLSIQQKYNQNHSSFVGIYFEDNIESYAGLLAIIFSGAAYVPLNPKFPIDRNKSALDKAEVSLLLYSENLPKELAADRACIQIEKKIYDQPYMPSKMAEFIETDIAYLLFTSGTTGEPKGVAVSKSNVEALFNCFKDDPTLQFDASDRFLQVYELSFDVSVFSFFMPLSWGAGCYILPQTGIRYLNILKMMKEHKITVVSMASTMLYFVARYLQEIQLPHLRLSLLTADALNHQLAIKWSATAPNCRIENWYGPTEGTIWCTRYVWEEKQAALETVNDLVAIGKPLPGIKAILVDEDLSPTPAGEKGELCISGQQVVTAYLNGEKPESFFEADYQGKQHLFYRTGDLVSLNSKGNLLFHGRADSQVKINAYRIELGEIEAALRKITDKMTAVVCMPNANGIKELYAFVEGKSIDEESIKKNLVLVLPKYMIPKHIFAITKIPTSLNGKIDRNQLKQTL